MIERGRRSVQAATIAVVLALAAAACGSTENASTSDAGDAAAESSPPAAEAAAGTEAPMPDTQPSDTPSSEAPSSEAAPQASAPSDAGAMTDGDPASAVPEPLRFSASLVGGGAYDPAALAGKPTVLWFWAPWCSICNREASSIEAAAQEFGDDVNFVGVAWVGSDDEFQEFIDDHQLSFPQVSDDPGIIYERFGVAYQPALVVVNTDGTTEMVAGAVDDELLHQIISESS